MTFTTTPIQQTAPPCPPGETLPTMSGLSSDQPEEPRLPDKYHYLQTQLFSATFRLTDYTRDRILTTAISTSTTILAIPSGLNV